MNRAWYQKSTPHHFQVNVHSHCCCLWPPNSTAKQTLHDVTTHPAVIAGPRVRAHVRTRPDDVAHFLFMSYSGTCEGCNVGEADFLTEIHIIK